MRKKILALTACLLLCGGTSALAAPGDARVAVGNDLSESQRAKVYAFFGIDQGSVEELTVTIDEERAALGDYVSADKIGTRSISSVYIRELDEGAGVTVETHNITWVTAEMYIAALTTAGVADACVVVAAPVGVSGTAALTGIYKCYESVTGEELSQEAKDAASEELVTTGELADLLGSEEALEFMNELKRALAQSESMTDDELREIIRNTASQLDIQLTDEQVEQLLGLVRKLARIDLDPEALLDQARRIQDSLTRLREAGEKAGSFITAVSNFWNKIVEWFRNLFGQNA